MNCVWEMLGYLCGKRFGSKIAWANRNEGASYSESRGFEFQITDRLHWNISMAFLETSKKTHQQATNNLLLLPVHLRICNNSESSNYSNCMLEECRLISQTYQPTDLQTNRQTTNQPTNRPTVRPTKQPTNQQPTNQPTNRRNKHNTWCDQKLWWMLLLSAIQRKGRDLQYGKRRVEP